MTETNNHPSSLTTCTLIQDFLGVTGGGIYEAVVQLKQRLDAVVAECAVVKSLNSKLCDELSGYETDNEDFGPAPQSLALAYSTETPYTDSALVEQQAIGVEKFAAFLDDPIDGKQCFEHAAGLARHFASTLRKGESQ